MIGHSLLDFPPLQEGILLKRYKRFLADVELESGEIVTAHCVNTGPMKGVLIPNGKVRLRYSPSSTRKLSWTLEQVEVIGSKGLTCWVGVNTSLANKLVRLAIEADFFKEEFGAIQEIRQEVVYGRDRRSRIDLCLHPHKENLDPRTIYVEVKNTTWIQGSVALFPDTVTTRGQKHLIELSDLLPQERGVLIPCITRDDAEVFAPGDSADKQYGNLFRKAILNGMEVLPCCFGFYRDCIRWEGKRSFRKKEFFS